MPGQGHSAGLVMQVYLIIVGLAFGFSIQAFVENPVTAGSVLRLVAMFVLLSEWLHGQIGYEDSPTYEVGGGWMPRLAEHYVELIAVALLMAAALVLERERPFVILVTLTYAVDAALEFTYLHRTRVVTESHSQERSVARSWSLMDMVALALLVPLVAIDLIGVTSEPFSSIGLLAVVLAIALWDYSSNRSFYFGLE